jgi:hypothetical protein
LHGIEVLRVNGMRRPVCVFCVLNSVVCACAQGAMRAVIHRRRWDYAKHAPCLDRDLRCTCLFAFVINGIEHASDLLACM